MNFQQRQMIEQELQKMVVTAARYMDTREFDRYADLFGTNGLLDRADVGPLPGNGSIKKFFANHGSGQLVRHVVSNIFIDVIDDRRATGISYVTTYQFDNGETQPKLPAPLEGPYMIGEWLDEYIRTTDGWRFARRKTVAILRVVR